MIVFSSLLIVIIVEAKLQTIVRIKKINITIYAGSNALLSIPVNTFEINNISVLSNTPKPTT